MQEPTAIDPNSEITMPLKVLLDLVIDGHDFATLDPEHYPAEAWVYNRLMAIPQDARSGVFHIFECANGSLKRLYRWAAWLASADHRNELKASLVVDHAELDARNEREAKAKTRLIKAFGETQGRKLFADILNGTMVGHEELKRKLGL